MIPATRPAATMAIAITGQILSGLRSATVLGLVLMSPPCSRPRDRGSWYDPRERRLDARCARTRITRAVRHLRDDADPGRCPGALTEKRGRPGDPPGRP